MTVPRSNLAAAGWMLAAVASFSLMDAGMKLLSEHYPPLQVTLLRGAASLLADAGYAIVNVDATIVTEAPKILPYAPQMRERVASALGTPVESVSIKATTNEQMGFIGRKEGIAALATVLIEGRTR